MQIQDTLTNTKKDLGQTGTIKIYICGITVYDECHIGHARTIIVFDVLRRYLESKGIGVEFIQNFTDVDDKIIDRAKKENKTANEISSWFIDRYFEDFDSLNVKRATKFPKATQHIDDMLNLIESLVKKEVAYVTKNGVYFAVTKFPEYGKLSKKKTGDLVSGARIEVDESKRDPLDFALWKFSENDPNWDSPWGSGRPGWHIECSAMAIKYLGKNFDIHGGGRDLIFPHHENEIAQSESHTSEPFAKIWMHVGMVTINGEKMSKSLGNIKSVKHVLENWGPNIIRLFCLSGHYSKPIDYSEDLLKENLTKWRLVESAYYELILTDGEGPIQEADKIINLFTEQFDSAWESDLNSHEALSAFFNLVKEVNRLASSETLNQSIAQKLIPIFEKSLKVLGLAIPRISEEEKNSINELIQRRETLRNEKKFSEADKIRVQIANMNVELIDHKTKTTWMKKEKIRSKTN